MLASDRSESQGIGAHEEDVPRKVHRTGSSIRARLRPGETAVMGYCEIAPGKLGASLVTPEVREDGTVSLQIMTIEVSDTMDLRTRAHDIFPDIFDIEKSGVVSRERKSELLRELLKSESAKTVSYPRMVSHPGNPCVIRSAVTTPTGDEMGTAYTFQADSIPGTRDLDLSVDFSRTGTREQE
jgi:hypothetical protein